MTVITNWRLWVMVCLASALIAPTFAQTNTPDTLNREPELDIVWEQIANQPRDFAAACMPLQRPSGLVLYNATERMPLASVAKLPIFIEYARRIDAGDIGMGEMVSLDDLNRYNLPRTDRGAHDAFMRRYPDSTDSISLWELASTGMMRYSSNAASDYLLDYLAPLDWRGLYADLAMSASDAPHPLTMIPFLMNNHDDGQPSLEDVADLSMADGVAMLRRYLEDEAWRTDEIAYRMQRRRNFPAWEIQSAILQAHTAKGTVYDYLNALIAIYAEDEADGGALSEPVKAMVRASLRWQGSDAIDNTYIEFGSKLGFYSGGTLTLVAYGHPRDGEPVVTALFFRNVPLDAYREMLRIDGIGNLAHWLNFNACEGFSEALLQATAG
jgi:hypothetical protein